MNFSIDYYSYFSFKIVFDFIIYLKKINYEIKQKIGTFK